jgi:hypothetical protein
VISFNHMSFEFNADADKYSGGFFQLHETQSLPLRAHIVTLSRLALGLAFSSLRSGQTHAVCSKANLIPSESRRGNHPLPHSQFMILHRMHLALTVKPAREKGF